MTGAGLLVNFPEEFWGCPALGQATPSRKKWSKTHLSATDVGSSCTPVPIWFSESKPSPLPCHVSVFSNVKLGKQFSSISFIRATAGFKARWCQWNTLKVYKMFHTCKILHMWPIPTWPLPMLTQLDMKSRWGSSSPPAHLAPDYSTQEASSSSPSYLKDHNLCMGGGKRILYLSPNNLISS